MTPRLALIPIANVHTDRVRNLRFTAPGDSAEGESRSPVEIAKSIATRGQDTPIDVTSADGGRTYDVIDGHTRVAAFRILTGATLPDVPDADWPKADPTRFAQIEARIFPPMTAAEVQYEALVRGSVRNAYTAADVAYRIGEILRGPLRPSILRLARDLGMPPTSVNNIAHLSGVGTYQGKPVYGLAPRVWDAWRRPRAGRKVAILDMLKVAAVPFGEQWEAWCELMPEDSDGGLPPTVPEGGEARVTRRIRKAAEGFARVVLPLVELGMLTTSDRGELAEVGARIYCRKGTADKDHVESIYRVALGLTEAGDG